MKRSVINVFIILLTFLIMTGGSGAVYTEKKQEKIKVNSASIGLTVSEPVFCNIPEEIRKALDHRNLYLFPHVLQTFERWTGSEILDSAMIILYCAGKNYLITTESSDGELQNFVSDIGQISVKDGWQRKYTLKMSAYDDEYGQFELYKRKGIRFS
jgi:hypothetical protein